ncbi:hypothetical protein M514_04128 [Trichuris suis]|uniref:Uncharacterized protein n=1 Tax=Trichuris suis TaxID=68888 RepID=A0A085NG27_9BILA|nr:hypothetical protein M513_04128 [Trichuris suis]KFD68423.1 hypothetical protein M514_04128 [Trichuris suis]
MESATNDAQPNRTCQSAPQVDVSKITKITGLIKKKGYGTFAVAICNDGKECYVPYCMAREALLPQLLDMYENDVQCEELTKGIETKKVD